jgi:hypothetical protein
MASPTFLIRSYDGYRKVAFEGSSPCVYMHLFPWADNADEALRFEEARVILDASEFVGLMEFSGQ